MSESGLGLGLTSVRRFKRRRRRRRTDGGGGRGARGGGAAVRERRGPERRAARGRGGAQGCGAEREHHREVRASKRCDSNFVAARGLRRLVRVQRLV
jgi:hypothetical protein